MAPFLEFPCWKRVELNWTEQCTKLFSNVKCFFFIQEAIQYRPNITDDPEPRITNDWKETNFTLPFDGFTKAAHPKVIQFYDFYVLLSISKYPSFYWTFLGELILTIFRSTLNPLRNYEWLIFRIQQMTLQ